MSAPKPPSIAAAVLTAVGMLAIGFFILSIVPSFVRVSDPSLRFTLTQGLKLVFAVALTNLLLVRLRKHAPEQLGLAIERRSLARFALGCGVGAGLVLLAFGMAWGAGAFVLTPAEPSPSVATLALLGAGTLCGAAFEELVFRVGLTGVLALSLPPGLAMAAPSAIFGLMHGLNPGATTLGVANTMLAGLLLGFLFFDPKAKTVPSLGLCTGFHFAWNFVLGTILGIPVSGHLSARAYLSAEPTDTLWSGGSYGLEGGVGATAVLVVAVVLAARAAKLPERSPA